MIPPDIHILHLSDLHISNGAISHVLSVLLSDITGQLMGVKNLIIAVTGDVIAEGDFDANEEAAFLFFKRLHDMIPLGCAVLDFLMVPGNHDVVRPSYKEGSSYLPSSDRYEGLQARVNELFESNHNQTFGVSIVPFNQRTIRIVRTDTSCNATPEDIRKQVKKAIQRDGDDRTTLVDEICAQRAEDYGKKFEAQTKTLRAQMDKSWAKSESDQKPVAITIVLSHMPLTWLQTDGAQIRDVLFRNGLDDVDIWLCGHAHRSQLYYTNDDGRSVLMLMTGIGRKDNANCKQRYSIYRLGVERNACAVKVRVTDNGLNFETEKSSDSFGDSKRYDYSCFPLRNRSASALLRLNSSDVASAKGFCFDGEAFDLLRELSLRISVLHERLSVEASKQIELVLNCLDGKKENWDHRAFAKTYEADSQDDLDLDKVGRFTKTIIEVRALKDLLTFICSCVVETFSRPLPNICDSGSNIVNKLATRIRWRAHFRYYALSSLHFLTGEIKDDCYYDCTSNDIGKPLKPLPWCDFLAAVYAHKEKSMVFSACSFDNKIETDWDDFLTAIPDLSDNRKAYRKFSPAKERPLLTFGLSLKGTDAEAQRQSLRILYLLEYLNLNRIITHCIHKFITSLPMNFEKVVKSFREA